MSCIVESFNSIFAMEDINIGDVTAFCFNLMIQAPGILTK